MKSYNIYRWWGPMSVERIGSTKTNHPVEMCTLIKNLLGAKGIDLRRSDLSPPVTFSPLSSCGRFDSATMRDFGLF